MIHSEINPIIKDKLESLQSKYKDLPESSEKHLTYLQLLTLHLASDQNSLDSLKSMISLPESLQPGLFDIITAIKQSLLQEKLWSEASKSHLEKLSQTIKSENWWESLPILDLVMRSIRTLDISQLSFMIEEGLRNSRISEGKDLILLLGEAGSGKSGFINLLKPDSRHENNFVEVIEIQTTVRNESDEEIEAEIFICDPPEIHDEARLELEIANATCIHQAILKARSVRPVLLVDLRDGFDAIQTLLMYVKNMMNDLKGKLSSFTIIFTGSFNESSEIELFERINDFKDSIIKEDDSLSLVAQLLDTIPKHSVLSLESDDSAKAKEILKEIMAKKPIENPSEEFRFYLDREIADALEYQIQRDVELIKNSIYSSNFELAAYKSGGLKDLIEDIEGLEEKYSPALDSLKELFTIDCQQSCRTIIECINDKKPVEEKDLINLKEKADKLKESKNFCVEFQENQSQSYDQVFWKILSQLDLDVEVFNCEEEVKNTKTLLDSLQLIVKYFPDAKELYFSTFEKLKSKIVIIDENFVEKVGQFNYQEASSFATLLQSICNILGSEYSKDLQIEQILKEWTLIFKRQYEELIAAISIIDTNTWKIFNTIAEKIEEANKHQFFSERTTEIEKKAEDVISLILEDNKNKIENFRLSSSQDLLQEIFKNLSALKEIPIQASELSNDLNAIISEKMTDINRTVTLLLETNERGTHNYFEILKCLENLKEYEWLSAFGFEPYTNNIKAIFTKIQGHAMYYQEKFTEFNFSKGNPEDYINAYKIQIEIGRMWILREVPDLEKIINHVTIALKKKKESILDTIIEKIKIFEETEPDFDFLQATYEYISEIVSEIPEDSSLLDCKLKISKYLTSYKGIVYAKFENDLKIIFNIIKSDEKVTPESELHYQNILDYHIVLTEIEKYETLRQEFFRDWTLEKFNSKMLGLYSLIVNKMGNNDYRLSLICKKLIAIDGLMPSGNKLSTLEEKIESKINNVTDKLFVGISVHMKTSEFGQVVQSIAKAANNKPVWNSLVEVTKKEMATIISEAKILADNVLRDSNEVNLQVYSSYVSKIINAYEELKDYLESKYLIEVVEKFKSIIKFDLDSLIENFEITKLETFYNKHQQIEKLSLFFKSDFNEFLQSENQIFLRKIEEGQAKYIETLETGFEVFPHLNPRKIHESIAHIPKAEDFRGNIVMVCKLMLKSSIEELKQNKSILEKLDCIKPIIRIFSYLPSCFGAPFEEKIMDLKELIITKVDQYNKLVRKIEASDVNWILEARSLVDQKAIGEIRGDIVKVTMPRILEVSQGIYSKLFDGTLEAGDLEEIVKAYKMLGFEEIMKVINEVQKAIGEEINSLIKQIELNQYSPSFELRAIEVNLNYLLKLADIMDSFEVLESQEIKEKVQSCIDKLLLQLNTSEQQCEESIDNLNCSKIMEHLNLLKNNGILSRLSKRSNVEVTIGNINNLIKKVANKIESLDVLSEKFDLKELMLSPQRIFFCEKLGTQYNFLKAVSNLPEFEILSLYKCLETFVGKLESLYKDNKASAEEFFQEISSDKKYSDSSLAEISNKIELVYLTNEQFSNIIKTDKNYSNVLEVRLEKELSSILSSVTKETKLQASTKILIRLKRFSVFILRFKENFSLSIDYFVKAMLEHTKFDLLEIACELNKDISCFGPMIVADNEIFSTISKLFSKNLSLPKDPNSTSTTQPSLSEATSTTSYLKSRTLIAVDGTSGMPLLLNKLKSIIPNLFKQLSENLKEKSLGSSFEVQFAVYRNYDASKKNILETSGWESESAPLRVFIDQVSAKYGLGNEAVEVALWHGLKESKELGGLAQMILIGDAAPNSLEEIEKNRKIKGEEYWGESNYKEVPHYTSLVEELKNQGVPVHCIYVDQKAKDAFEEISRETNGKADGLKLQDKDVGDKLMNMIGSLIMESLEGNPCVSAREEISDKDV